MSANLTISAVGDISFEGRWADSPNERVFASVTQALKESDLVVGNLEGPLYDGHNPVAIKTTLRGSPLWASVLAKKGFRVLSLANNHIMDHGEEGLFQTMQVLDKIGIVYAGAGEDLETACAPAFLDISGTHIAFLGRSSVIVSSRSNALTDSAGIAFFDLDETKQRIKECKQKADLVILMMHWGLEEYRYPAPAQRANAQELVQCGADIILGHHPHVLQGIEYVYNGLVCYSLGNFFFDEFWWTLSCPEGKTNRFFSDLTEENRKSGIFSMRFSEKGLESYGFIPTRIDSEGILQTDKNSKRDIDFKRICVRLHRPCYKAFWRLYSFKQEWDLRIKPRLRSLLTLSKLKRIRPRHIIEFVNLIKKSNKIVKEESTNPYE